MTSLLTGKKPPKVRTLTGKCGWCSKNAQGWAQKGLGQYRPSCGDHGNLFRLVK